MTRPRSNARPPARRRRRRPAGGRSPRRRGNGRRLLGAVIVVILLLLLLGVIPSCGHKPEGEAKIYITAGSSTADIARSLHDQDVIDDEKDFVKKAEEMGVDEDLKPGTYVFERGMPVEEIIEILASGEQAPEGTLTIPEGYSIADIARQLSGQTDISARDYYAATSAVGRRLPLKGAQAETLEGFLFPSTYDLEPGMNASELVDKQLETFREQTSGLEWQHADTLGVSEYQVLIVASMVEREAKVPDERPLVAAVIYNRLAQGMKLEVDATVQYALGWWKPELTQEDLAIDSPYNTRLYAGLPPGPICNPGRDAIEAALNPAAVDYLYYVATGDAEGHHFFTSSFEEFLAHQQ